MAAICGVITRGQPGDPAAAQGLLGRLVHGMAGVAPRATPVCEWGHGRVVLAQPVFSGFAGHEWEGAPAVSPDGRWYLAWSGFLSNREDILRLLMAEGQGHPRARDEELVLAAISLWGLNRTIQKIYGAFVFAAWDRDASALHLVRDQSGQEQLYIAAIGPHIVFAPSLRAVLAAYPTMPAYVPAAVSAFDSYGFVQAPGTLFEGVWALPAGHRLMLQGDSEISVPAAMEAYWRPARHYEEAHLKGGLVKPHTDLRARLHDTYIHFDLASAWAPAPHTCPPVVMPITIQEFADYVSVIDAPLAHPVWFSFMAALQAAKGAHSVLLAPHAGLSGSVGLPQSQGFANVLAYLKEAFIRGPAKRARAQYRQVLGAGARDPLALPLPHIEATEADYTLFWDQTLWGPHVYGAGLAACATGLGMRCYVPDWDARLLESGWSLPAGAVPALLAASGTVPFQGGFGFPPVTPEVMGVARNMAEDDRMDTYSWSYFVRRAWTNHVRAGKVPA